jgi:RNA polymerase sigma-70 factor, ECF subfamily
LAFSSTRTGAEFLVVSLKKEKPRASGSTNEKAISLVEEPADEVLLTLLRESDREAIGCLFRRYARPVLNIGQRILRDFAEAEDLVQEVFLYVYRKSALFDGSRGSARSWIFQIAYTQAFMRRRHLISQRSRMSGIADNSSAIELRTSFGPEYDHSVQGLFGRNGWRKVLELLSEEQRETLRLHFFEGHTFEEIAEKLGQSYGNVRNHHYRGLEKLRKSLAENALNRR